MPVCNVYLFGSDVVATPFLRCYNSGKKTKISIGNKNYSLKIYPDVQWMKPNFFETKKTELIGDAIVVLFSVLDPDSFENVRKKWTITHMKSCNPFTPVILVGCNAGFRIKIERSEELASLENEQISTEMGEQLARKINASKYIEYSAIDETNLQDIYEEVVRTSICYQNVTPSFRIFVMGKQKSRVEMIRRFVYADRLNVLSKSLNDQPHFSNDDKREVSTHIEIDGEEFHLVLKDAKNSNEIFTSLYWYVWLNETLEKYGFINAVILVFSVIEPNLFNAITKRVVLQIREHDDLPEHPIPIIVIENQTDLRNDPETLNNLSKLGKSPITYELGEQLAREIKLINTWNVPAVVKRM